ncbi:GntR family transcriptional regulator [Vibrio sinaloensis]|uniref:GntR family transcriptional regulator n=1 Tax=Photobacterium sp. (strain ATCC 43367) TaxID=379097 RepID=UPI0020626F15|nr:GntR family transcriptional regulator [Vibrio sinaloensis]UPQ89466.1 GntR family transcriptional regulator [Vibrio sinaloensis]
MTDWNDSQPIFRQLADRIIEQILQGIWSEGQALPSVRSVAADLKINHLTVMKGYQLLVDEDLIEKRRGQGMFVTIGALNRLRIKQKQNFIEQQIPAIATKLQQLEIPLDEFIVQLKQHVKGEV